MPAKSGAKLVTNPADSLAEYLRGAPLPLLGALRYAIGVAEGLRDAHRRGRVYGFLRPEIIAIVDGQARLSHTGPVPVTPYFSPEQAAGKEPDTRSDIFSWGALMYEMLSGRPPFCAATRTALRLEIQERQPAPLEHVPTNLARLVARCLEKKPEQRVQRAALLLAELKLVEVLARGTSEQHSPESPAPRLAAWAETKPAPSHNHSALSSPKHPVACRTCGSYEVHHSRPQGLLEFSLVMVGLTIYRCHRCASRFLPLGGFSIRKSDRSHSPHPRAT
jgi:serine/threonine protein kinase